MASGARRFLPNRVNRIVLPDLDGVVRAEMEIEYWGGHVGTSGKAVRVNGHAWHTLPRPEIPGDAGRRPDVAPECYQHFSWATVELSLEQLQAGDNTFEFAAGPQLCGDFGWGQWAVYAVTFRLFVDPAAGARPTGRIVTPAPATVIGDSVAVEVEASSPLGPIEAVDVIGLYEDFDFEGNGRWRQWHAISRYGKLYRHIGTLDAAPWRTLWDSRWVPDQEEPVALVARIRDATGLHTLTPPVQDLRLARPRRSVRLYKPYDVPVGWVSRVGRWQSADLFIPEDLTRATAARLLLTTWSGGYADSVGINRRRVLGTAGPKYDYGYIAAEVPLDLLRRGSNSVFTAAGTPEHGIEVMWPGIALLVEYDGQAAPPPPPAGDLVLYGDAPRAGWSVSTPEDVEVEAGRDLRIDLSTAFRDFLLLRGDPLSVDGYRALRLDLHPGELRLAGYHSLDLVVWGGETPLIERGEGRGGFDPTRAAWQTVEIPLQALYLRRPYIDGIGFRGQLAGHLRIDDIRLVVDGGTAVGGTTGSAAAAATPESAELEAAFPNPFNPATRLGVRLPAPARVHLAVHNLAGQRVATLADGVWPAGRHEVGWEGRDDDGRRLASGVYVIRLRTATTVAARRVVLLR